MKIIYMGTPGFSASLLEYLAKSGHDVAAVFTQPDRPQGRKQIMTPPPVKSVAKELGIDVFAPEKIRDGENIDIFKRIAPDVCVVAAFGQILPAKLLEIPRFGCVNVHASLLPRYRGASPIQWSIINGDAKTGVSIMRMNEGLDTGDIILQKELPLTGRETAGSLFESLAVLSRSALGEALCQLEDGTAVYTAQRDEDASYVKTLSKKDGLIDWSKPGAEIERMIRGLDPWPCAYTFYKGNMLKLFNCSLTDKKALPVCGQVMIENGCMYISCQDVMLCAGEVLPAGKKRMSSGDFIRGYHDIDGTVLGAADGQ